MNATSGRPKSKSPRRSKHDHHAEQLPSPPHSPRPSLGSEDPDTISPLARPPFPPAHSHKISTASSPYPAGNSSVPKVPRRPHTSAGPRDWPSTLDTRENCQNFHNQSSRLAVPPRPETDYPTRFPKSPPSSRSLFRQRSVWGSSSTMGSGGHLGVESSQHHSHGSLLFERANVGDVQAWEQELARIESASRRNSADMLGFLSQRKKASVEQPSISTYLHAEG